MAYKSSNSTVLKLWDKLGSFGIGRWIVSKIVCFAAPFCNSIKPKFTAIKPGHVELTFKKRRAVQNHIKSVHAIAMCNAAELAAGICLDVSLHADFRWIPVGMTVQYLKIAKTDLRTVCELDQFDWESPQDVIMPVSIYDTSNVKVFHADISMRVSAKKSK
jgi:acyl-coenzyme A thioesterase PaaI-like protein